MVKSSAVIINVIFEVRRNIQLQIQLQVRHFLILSEGIFKKLVYIVAFGRKN